ncbi:MAG: SUMF1/EgtB/PvdO family nonheme iron enzyme [Thermodesulfobacteriota bacterium]|nr:SUMF1/EgtB/PvdO family nonheme iron enzyme [Thermodesulfobacteriota bacterium]
MRVPDGVLLKDRFRIDGILGEGGMGRVYEVFDLSFKGKAALKEMLIGASTAQELKEAQERFIRESNLLLKLKHPKIPNIFDFFTIESRCFIAMEYIEGETLSEYLQKHPKLDEDKIVEIGLQICDILACLHSQNPPVVYRDLKPQNLMITKDRYLYMIDFGIAREVSSRTGTAIGTDGYAAPEVYENRLDVRSDLYSLGGVLHYALTMNDPEKRKPFTFKEHPVAKYRTTKYEWQTLLDKLLADNLDERYGNAKEVRSAIEALRDGKLVKSIAKKPSTSASRPVKQPCARKTVNKAQPPVSPAAQVSVSVVPKTPPSTAPAVSRSPAPVVSQVAPAPPPFVAAHYGPPVERVNMLDNAEVILIPSGDFIMGSPAGVGSNNECPQHNIYLDAYYIYKYPVTNKQFKQFIDTTGYKAEGIWENLGTRGTENHPVVSVTWSDAAAYCKWAGGTLPTEAQWEKAARGTDGRAYPWGNTWDTAKCNWKNEQNVADMMDMTEGRGTTPVGSFPQGKSPYGVHDMMGNVWEWCDNCYNEKHYESSPKQNPNETGKDGSRVLRGGSWCSESTEGLRCARRYSDSPEARYLNYGFRVVLPYNSKSLLPATSKVSSQYAVPPAIQTPASPSQTSTISEVKTKTVPQISALSPLQAPDAAKTQPPALPKTSSPEQKQVSSAPLTPASSIPSERINPVDNAEMILIPAGEFVMGSPDGQGIDNEHPQHKIYLDAYYIYKYPVTNGQFQKFIDTNGYKAQGEWKKYAPKERERHPVIFVTWDDAVAYCRWAGGSLPTEAQWEKAARGTDGREYTWGDAWDPARCNWRESPKVAGMAEFSGGRGTTPVGSFPSGASPWGVHDMAGNVWEWCADWYGETYYQESPSKNPEGPESRQYRVLRGGSWTNGSSGSFRCANRYWVNPDLWLSLYFGFRVVLPYNSKSLLPATSKVSSQYAAPPPLPDVKKPRYEAQPSPSLQGGASPSKKISLPWYQVAVVIVIALYTLWAVSAIWNEFTLLPSGTPSQEKSQAAGPSHRASSSPDQPASVSPAPFPSAHPTLATFSNEKENSIDGAEMIFIPAGEFLRGSPEEEGSDDECPQHRVYLDDYYIYKYEVTNAQFRKFISETGYSADGNWRDYALAGRERHPVVCVTWNDAKAYCEWAEGRLPTEAQWEKAARGGDGRKYPWGNKWDGTKCNWDGGPKVAHMADILLGRGTVLVGSFSEGVSPYGVHDMAGNVWEWCADRYGKNYYRSSPLRNPEGPGEGVYRVLRGGSWNIGLTDYLRCADRLRNNPGNKDYGLGFRVCLSSSIP